MRSGVSLSQLRSMMFAPALLTRMSSRPNSLAIVARDAARGVLLAEIARRDQRLAAGFRDLVGDRLQRLAPPPRQRDRGSPRARAQAPPPRRCRCPAPVTQAIFPARSARRLQHAAGRIVDQVHVVEMRRHRQQGAHLAGRASRAYNPADALLVRPCPRVGCLVRAAGPKPQGRSAPARAGAQRAARRQRRARRLCADPRLARPDARAAPGPQRAVHRRHRGDRDCRRVRVSLPARRPHHRQRAAGPHPYRREGRHAVGAARGPPGHLWARGPGLVRGPSGSRLRQKPRALSHLYRAARRAPAPPTLHDWPASWWWPAPGCRTTPRVSRT